MSSYDRQHQVLTPPWHNLTLGCTKLYDTVKEPLMTEKAGFRQNEACVGTITGLSYTEKQ